MHLDETMVARFVEHRLDDTDVARVETHIDGCAACRALVAALARGSDDRSDVATALATGSAAPTLDAGGDDAALVASGTRVGRYVVVGVLGRGAMGVVYAAFDPDLDRKVAVKLLRRGAAASDDARARLVREAQALAKVSHPAVIAVHDVGTHAGQTFVAMELVDAGTLRTWLAGATRSPRDIADVIAQVGAGLAAAHATGLIHRDVKPDNILVGADRRGRIGDFGLAVAVAAARRSSDPVIDAASRSVLGEPLTATGATVGTPAYMAPEQLRGGSVTAASDQFSLCATLYEALYGVRPFPGDTIDAIAAAMRTGTPAPPAPARPAVPAAIDRAVRRGLAIDPDRRFPTMIGLVAALRPAPVSRWAWIAAGVTAVAGTALIASQLAAAPAPCGGMADQLRPTWNPTVRGAVAAIGGNGKPYARATADETVRVLDGYAAAWVAERTDACRATRVRGDQSERVLDQRIACLERRRHDLQGLITTLTAAGSDVTARAVEAAVALEPIAACGDVASLAAQPVDPVAPELRAVADDLAGVLAGARSQLVLGRYAKAGEAAAGVAGTAADRGLRQLAAEAQLVHGQATFKLGDPAAAAPLLRDAARAAEVIHADELAARARIAQVTAAIGTAALEDAHDRLGDAQAAVERAGATLSLRAEIATQDGVLAAMEGRYDDARGAFERALALVVELHPGDGDDLPVARATANLGNSLYSLGRYADAQAKHERALAIRRARLGDDHPDVATTRINLANDLSQQGRSDDALREYREGLRVIEGSVGPDSPVIASTLSSIGLELESEGKLDEALAAHRRAIELLARREPGPELGLAHENLAGVLGTMGKPVESIAEHEQAIAIREAVLGTEHPDVAQSLTNMALALTTIGKHTDALAALDRALAIKTKALGTDHPRLGPTLSAIGQVQLALHHPAAAVAPLTRAVQLLAAGDPLDVAECQVMLARALHGTGKHAAARTTAAAAEAAYTAAGKTTEAAAAHALAN